MTRHVYSNGMVIHLWANQSASRARSSNGSLRFEGRTLYSYSTPIANFVDGPRGPVALITTQKYSTTTGGKHMPSGSALPAGALRAYAPNIGATGGMSREKGFNNMDDMHTANMAAIVADYEAEKARLLKAVKSRGPSPLTYTRERLGYHIVRMHSYAHVFGIEPLSIGLATDVALIAERFERLERDAVDPKALVRKEKAAAALRLRKEAKEKAERERERLLFEAWRDGARVNCPPSFRIAPDGGAYLRLSPDGRRVQTSQGAEVLINDALKLFRFAKLIRERSTKEKPARIVWVRNGARLLLTHFELVSVRADGGCVVGCHYLSWTEIERCARAAGLYSVSGADTTVDSGP